VTQIGYFKEAEQGFVGRIQMLGMDHPVVFDPIEPGDDDNAPDYHLHLGEDNQGLKIGAGWENVGDKSGPYVSVIIDSPLFAEPLRAGLFSADADLKDHVLVWSRRKPRDEA
jgi:uncharacterized protein (DUF736 family)